MRPAWTARESKPDPCAWKAPAGRFRANHREPEPIGRCLERSDPCKFRLVGRTGQRGSEGRNSTDAPIPLVARNQRLPRRKVTRSRKPRADSGMTLMRQKFGNGWGAFDRAPVGGAVRGNVGCGADRARQQPAAGAARRMPRPWRGSAARVESGWTTAGG